jgi:Tol biopolymer transport system component/DNA-binding winged helix-turn-helix (wHTH) protein
VTESRRLKIGDFRLDKDRFGLFRRSKRVVLPTKAFEVLCYLADRPGKVIPKQTLLTEVWGGQRADNTVEQAIRQIRRALGDEPTEARYIRTVSGEGYCFVFPVEPEPPEDRNARRWTARRIAALSVTLLAVMLAAVKLRPALPAPHLKNPLRITRSPGRIFSPILAGGRSIYYQGFEQGVWRVLQAPEEGGESTAVATDLPNAELCDIARDGSALLLRSLTVSRDELAPVYIQPLPQGAARRVGDIQAYDAAWEPDGRHILLSSGGAIFRVSLDDKRAGKLCQMHGHIYWMRRSPGGRRLRFTVIDSETEVTSLWELGPGGNLHRLFPGFKNQQCCGDWTPDGSYYVFQVRTEYGYQIWARREKESWFYTVSEQPAPLTLGPFSYRGPYAGRDGKLYARAEVERGELLRFDKKRNEFVALPSGITARTASFSPDGQWVAYSGLPDPNLWRSRSDGRDRIQLTTNFLQTAMPVWRPDGRTIAFMGRQTTGTKWTIYVIDPEGGAARALFSDGRNDAEPAWSPDGKRLAYCHWLEGPDGMAIYMVDAGNPKPAMVPGSAGMAQPRWSPDGRMLAAVRVAEGWLEMLDVASGRWRELTRYPSAYPNWSGDGKFVYFTARDGGGRSVRRVRIADGAIEDVADLRGAGEGRYFLGDWMGLGPGDAPLVARDVSTEDIFAWEFDEP